MEARIEAVCLTGEGSTVTMDASSKPAAAKQASDAATSMPNRYPKSNSIPSTVAGTSAKCFSSRSGFAENSDPRRTVCFAGAGGWATASWASGFVAHPLRRAFGEFPLERKASVVLGPVGCRHCEPTIAPRCYDSTRREGHAA